jgi:hypothetical protein
MVGTVYPTSEGPALHQERKRIPRQSRRDADETWKRTRDVRLPALPLIEPALLSARTLLNRSRKPSMDSATARRRRLFRKVRVPMRHGRHTTWLLALAALVSCVFAAAALAYAGTMTGTITLAGGSTATSSTVVPITSAIDPVPLEMRFSNGDSWTDWTPYSASAEVTVPAGDGVKSVTAEFRDADASVYSTSAMITLDTVAPLGDFAVAAGASYTTTADVVVDYNPYLETPSQMRFSTDDGATWTTWQAYAATHALSLPAPDGTKTVLAEYRDEAGNVASVSDSVVLDTTPPSGVMSIDGGAAVTKDRDVSLDSTVTGAVDMAVSTDGGATFGTFVPYTAHLASTLPSGADGTRTMTVRYRDAAGNTFDRSDTIALDTTPATTTVTTSPATPDGRNGWYVTTPTVTLSASEQGSVLRYKWTAGAAWTAYASGLTVAEGNTTLYVSSIDPAGNVEPTRTTSFKVDLTKPTGTLAISGGASQTSTTAVTADFTAGPETPTDMRFSTDGGTTWTSWTGYAASYALRLPVGDGTKTVKAEYRDAAGNVLAVSDSIVLDSTGPSGVMSIDGGATLTNDRAISVDATVTGAVDMAVSVDGGASFGAFVPYTAHTAATLPSGADGVRTVVVRYRDTLGNTTDIADAITLDTLPSVTTKAAAPATPNGVTAGT